MKKTTGKKIHSVLVDDLQHCIVTGSPEVAMHHVFNGPCRSLSDRYGFIVPLRPDWHNMTPYIGTREQFIAEFGKSYL